MGELADRMMARLEGGPVTIPRERRTAPWAEPELTTVPPTPVDRYLTCRRCWTGRYESEIEREAHEATCTEGSKPMPALTHDQKARIQALRKDGLTAPDIAAKLGLNVHAVSGYVSALSRVAAGTLTIGNDRERVTCAGCGWEGQRRYLEDHEKRCSAAGTNDAPSDAAAIKGAVHQDEAPRVESLVGCPFCRNGYPLDDLGAHAVEAHAERPAKAPADEPTSYRCPWCDVVSYTAADAQGHTQDIHTTHAVVTPEAASAPSEPALAVSSIRLEGTLDGRWVQETARRALAGLHPESRYHVTISAEVAWE